MMMTGPLLAWIQTLVIQHIYRPQTKFGQCTVFTPVCDSVHGVGGVCMISEGSLSRGVCPGRSLSRGGLCPGGVPGRETPSIR